MEEAENHEAEWKRMVRNGKDIGGQGMPQIEANQRWDCTGSMAH